MEEKEILSWEDVEDFIDKLVAHISEKGLHFSGIYGIPRGGLIPASILSYRLGIPLLLAPTKDCIIIDDIADSGKTLMHFTLNDTQFNKYFIATIFYSKRSLVKPDFYTREKTDRWIEFPWEKGEV